jgi:hypothetical protein
MRFLPVFSKAYALCGAFAIQAAAKSAILFSSIPF